MACHHPRKRTIQQSPSSEIHGRHVSKRHRSRGAIAPELCHAAPLPSKRGAAPVTGAGGAAGGARGLRDPIRRALRSARLHAHGSPPVTRGDRIGACAPSDVGRSASRRSTLATSLSLGRAALETPPGARHGTLQAYYPIGILSRGRHSGTARRSRTRNPDAPIELASGFRVRAVSAPRNDWRHNLSSQLSTVSRPRLHVQRMRVGFPSGHPSSAPPDTDGRHDRSGHGTWLLLAAVVVHVCRPWLSVTGYGASGLTPARAGNGSESL